MRRVRIAAAGIAGAVTLLVASAGTASGPVVLWGLYGEPFTPPPTVDGTTGGASAIAAGGSNYPVSCAIQARTDAVRCWGDDRFGQADVPDSVNGTNGTATAVYAITP